MRDDLLEAQAAIDWATANFPSLKQRLDGWLKLDVRVEIKELEPDVPNDLIVATEKEPLPLAFNVEVGAYLNALRSSLDILACAIARRHGVQKIDNVYFPVARSADHFASGNYKGKELIKGIPPAERAKIESLKPYEGGNLLLWSLHHLDIVRKHQRLLEVQVSPRTFSITMWGDIDEYITMVSTGWKRSTDQEAVLALIKKGAPKPQMRLSPHVSLIEPALGRKPLINALDDFASLAHSIIGLFDAP